jgi:predicted MFS family arabinose efflux permease
VLAGLAATARGMVAGVRHLAHRPAASTILIANALQRGLYGLLFVTMLLLYRNYYSHGNLTASMGGLLQITGAAAIGPLVAAVVTPPATRWLGGPRWIAVMFGSLAVAVPVLGLPFRSVATIVAALLISLVTQGARIVTDTALQVEIADDYRGRVFSVNDTAINLMYVAGLCVGALVLPVDGHSPLAMVLAGVGYAALTTWFVAAHPRRRVEV